MYPKVLEFWEIVDDYFKAGCPSTGTEEVQDAARTFLEKEMAGLIKRLKNKGVSSMNISNCSILIDQCCTRPRSSVLCTPCSTAHEVFESRQVG